MNILLNKSIKIFLIIVSLLFWFLALGYFIIELLKISNFITLNSYSKVSIFNFNTIMTIITFFIFMLISLVPIIYIIIKIFKLNSKLKADFLYIILYIIFISIILIITEFVLQNVYGFFNLYTNYYNYIYNNIENENLIILINGLILNNFCNSMFFMLLSILILSINYFILDKDNKKLVSREFELQKSLHYFNNNNTYSIKRKELEHSLNKKQELLKIIDLQNKINTLNEQINLKTDLKKLE